MAVKQVISWATVILWMALIFYLSHQPATESAQLSRGLTALVLQTIETLAPGLEIDAVGFHSFVRKAAHFTAYFVLGVLVVNALNISAVRGYRGVAYALLICVLYAISDEFHQTFVPGRSGEVMDVLIDSLGSGAGILVYGGLKSLRRAKGSDC